MGLEQRSFGVEPWSVRETGLDLDRLGHAESVFALANGHIGLRGNLDEGDPHGLPGTYLNSFFEHRPLPYAEGGYGYPESGQAILNVTNGKLFRLLVDDEPLDIRYGELRTHERVLDLRSGTLTRELEWVSPAGKAVRVRSERLVSLAQRAVAAISYTVEPVDQPLLVVVQSQLTANEDLPAGGGDPRVEAALIRPLLPEGHVVDDSGVTLLHRVRESGLRMAATMTHDVDGPPGVKTHSSATEDLGRTTVICRLEPGQRLRVVKYLAYGWSSRRSMPALTDQVRAALTVARYQGWAGLLAEQRQYLDDFWASADVEVDGDPQLQQAVRFGLFHVLQAGARAEGRAIAAKGLTGTGYDGHTFWDTETFVLPMLSHTIPDAAADACAGVSKPCPRPANAPASWAWPAPRSRGGPSGAWSVPATGPRGRPPSTSTRTSPTPRSGTSTPPTTPISNARSPVSCWWRPHGCGRHSGSTAPAAASASTGSPGRTSTARSRTTTSTPT